MLTVVVPVYNEETALRQFHRTMTGVMDASGIAYELLYVNDGSTDASGALLDELGAPAMHLERNRGYGPQSK